MDRLTALLNAEAVRLDRELSALAGTAVHFSFAPLGQLQPDSLLNFLEAYLGTHCLTIAQQVSGGIDGQVLFLIPHDQVNRLLEVLLPGEVVAARGSTADRTLLAEIGNLVLNTCARTLKQRTDLLAQTSLPDTRLGVPIGELARSLLAECAAGRVMIALAVQISVELISSQVHPLIVYVIRPEVVIHLETPGLRDS